MNENKTCVTIKRAKLFMKKIDPPFCGRLLLNLNRYGAIVRDGKTRPRDDDEKE